MGSMVSRAELYRVKANECANEAHRLTNPEAKRLYVQLAERWRQLADDVEFADRLKP